MSGDPKIRRLRPQHARGLDRRQGPDGCDERDPITGKMPHSPPFSSPSSRRALRLAPARSNICCRSAPRPSKPLNLRRKAYGWRRLG